MGCLGTDGSNDGNIVSMLNLDTLYWEEDGMLFMKITCGRARLYNEMLRKQKLNTLGAGALETARSGQSEQLRLLSRVPGREGAPPAAALFGLRRREEPRGIRWR